MPHGKNSRKIDDGALYRLSQFSATDHLGAATSVEIKRSFQYPLVMRRVLTDAVGRLGLDYTLEELKIIRVSSRLPKVINFEVQKFTIEGFGAASSVVKGIPAPSVVDQMRPELEMISKHLEIGEALLPLPLILGVYDDKRVAENDVKTLENLSLEYNNHIVTLGPIQPR